MDPPKLESSEKKNIVIKDRYHFVFISATLLGVVILFPWNVLITVTSYWNFKFRNVSLDNNEDIINNDDDELTDLQLLYGTYLSIAANIPNATFVILHALFGHHFNIKLRLYGSLVSLTCWINLSYLEQFHRPFLIYGYTNDNYSFNF